MKLVSVCLGQSGTISGRRPYASGIFKSPVSGPVMVDAEGLVGDRIINRKHHGGVEQAIYAEGAEDIAFWEAELGRSLPPGTFGENLIIEGMANRDIAAGDRLVIGEVELEATSPRMPCATFAARLADKTIVKTYTAAARPGVYFRVLAPGFIEAGMDVRLIPYQGERVTMVELMARWGQRLEGAERARILASPVNARIKAFLAQPA